MKRFVTVLLVIVLSALPVSSGAGLLSSLGKLADNAGDAAGATRKVDGVGGTDLPHAALRAAKDPDTTPLALGFEADGSVRLTDELGRSVVVPHGGDLDALLRTASNGSGKAAVVVDPKHLFLGGKIIGDLAERGALKLWYGGRAYPVQASDTHLHAVLRTEVLLSLGKRSDRAAAVPNGKTPSMVRLREVSYALDKTVNRGTVVVAEFGTPAKGPRRVGFGDGPSGTPGETLKVTRDDLLSGFSGNRGGTVVLAGRVRDGTIATKSGNVLMSEIEQAAAAADVHLLVVNGPAKAAHKALAKATTYGDLLTGLAPDSGALIVDALPMGNNRVRLTMKPETPPTEPPKTVAEDLTTVAEAAVHVGVHGVVRGAEFYTRDQSHERDLSMRLVPFAPYWVHVLYGLNFVLGLFGATYAWRLWRRIWPMKPRARRVALAHLPRFSVFLVIFLPLTGFVWAIVAFLASIGNTVMAILRLIGLVPRKPA